MKLHQYRFRKLMGILAACLPVSLVSCKWTKGVMQYEYGKSPIAEIRGEVLYEEDFKQMIPLGLSESDSISFVSQYIKNWAQDVLFYQNAIRNIPDTKDIDQLVENYRRLLFEHEYQRRLIEQKFSSEITEDQIEQFYNDNLRLFELDETLVKGLFLKISNKSHDLDQIRGLYTQTDDVSFEEIEKYSVRNASRCEFFYENWRSLAELEVLLPQMDKPLESLLQNQSSFEFRDDEYIYLLNISGYVLKGGIEPLEHAKTRIRGLLINSNEVNYMRMVKEDLYQNALDKNIIIFHSKEKR